MDNLLTVSEAAKELNVSARRIHQFIEDKRLPAEKLGSYYVIKRVDLDSIRDRQTGRPPKVKGEK